MDMLTALDAAAARARTAPDVVLDSFAWLGEAIAADRAAGRFADWGRSTVIDENLNAPVLSRELFDALHERAGVGAEWPVGNAGVLHVYGYLLSTVATPYGLKRDRWLDGGLAGAYGLTPEAFVPWAGFGTLLERVSSAASGLLARAVVRKAPADGAEAVVALDRVPTEGPWALAYSVRGMLVTTFPVLSREQVLADWDAEPDRVHWNAVA